MVSGKQFEGEHYSGLVECGQSGLLGQVWSRVNDRLGRDQGGQGHAQEILCAEGILQHLRAVEIDTGKGLAVLDACRKLGITEHRYDRWKKEYGGCAWIKASD